MKILGVDPSISSTGVALLEMGPDPELLDVFRIRHDLTAHKGMSVIEKTASLFKQLITYCNDHAPELVVVENIRVSAKITAKTGDATNKTVRAQQTAILAAVMCGIPVVEVEASKWRRLIACGANRTEVAKERVRIFVNNKFENDLAALRITHLSPQPLRIEMAGIGSTQNDMSDAIGIALVGKILK